VAARSSSKKQVETAPATPPRRVEIRVDGRVRFSNDVYDVELTQENDVVKFTGALHPTLVEVAKRPPERFDDRSDDPRDGEEVIQKVHTGSRRQTAAPSPKES
jgi:hypothetical protein